MRVCIFIWASLCLTPVAAQQLFFQPIPADVYKGATQNWDVVQDNQGVLYFANNDGVLTFDGRDWNLLPMPNKDFVFSVALDNKGNIYVASFNEFGFFERDGRGGHTYHSLVTDLPGQYRDFKYLDEIIVYSDEVFFVHKERIFHYNGERLDVMPQRRGGMIVLNNTLHLFRNDSVYVYDQNNFHYSSLSTALTSIDIRWVGKYEGHSFIILDNKNVLWTLNPGDGANAELTMLSEIGQHLAGLLRFRMLALDNGMLAILSREELLFLDRHARPVARINKEAVGENLTNRLLFQDNQHNLWVTTNASLIQVTTSSPLSFYDKHNGLSGTVMALGQHGEQKYVGTTTGVFYMEHNDRFTAIPECSGEAWNFYSFNGRFYVAHGTGVFELQGRRATRLVSHNFVHSLSSIPGRDDMLMMGTYNSGIWIIRKAGTTWVRNKVHGFEEETRFIQPDDQNKGYWISHYNKGIFHITLNERMDSVSAVKFYDQAHGLPSRLNNRIHRMKDGRLVVTTTDGLYGYNETKDGFEPLEGFDAMTGNNISIYAWDQNPQGDVYFWGGFPDRSEYAGVWQKEGGNYRMEATPFRKAAISVRDHRVDVDAPVMCIGGNEVWIGNNGRVIRYDPQQKTFFGEPFQAMIRKVWARDSLLHPSSARLPYSHNSIRMEFTSVFFENPDKTEYQFMLQGFSSDWSPWSMSNEAVYTNLPEGNYTFTVRARNVYGSVGLPASYSFYILPPWYKTWWAYAGYVLMLASFTALMININTRRIRKSKMVLEKKVRKKTEKLRARNKEVLEKNNKIEKQARELEALNFTKDKLFSIVSHDLRGPLKQIQVIMDMMEKEHLSEDDFKAHFPKLKESIEHTVNLTDNLLHWANSQMEGIQAQPSPLNIRQIARENYQLFKPLADGKQIILVNAIDTDLYVYADRDMIRLVLRNLVNNAIKFTKSGERILLAATRKHAMVEISVEDTGIGIPGDEIDKLFTHKHTPRRGTVGEKGIGLGLQLCHEFIEKNGGSIRVKSKSGKGSTFIISLPAINVRDAKEVSADDRHRQ
jgi:signal transduction histidine kinase